MVSRRPTSWLQVARLTAPPRPVSFAYPCFDAHVIFSCIGVEDAGVRLPAQSQRLNTPTTTPSISSDLLRDDVVVRVGRFKHPSRTLSG